MKAIVIFACLAICACGNSPEESHAESGGPQNKLSVEEHTPDLTAADAVPMSGETRNGGYGVRLDDRIVSFDLAFRGVHEDPYDSSAVNARLSTDERAILDFHLGAVASVAVIDIVEKKIVELDDHIRSLKLPYPRKILLDSMNQHTWLHLKNLSCLDVHDQDAPFPHMVQLAFRENIWIRFCQEFDQLDDVHQAALILHEIVYAAQTTKAFTPELIGFLFSPTYEAFDAQGVFELRAIIGEQSRALRGMDHYVHLERSAPVGSHIKEALGFGDKETLCYGTGYGQKETMQSLWLSDTNQCATGDSYETNRFLAPVTSLEHVYANETLIGDIDARAGTVTDLCSGPYLYTCNLKRKTSGWQFHVLIPDPSLPAAIRAGSLERVKYLIEQGADPEQRESASDKRPLMISLEENTYDITAYLARHGVDVNTGWPLEDADSEEVVALLQSPSIEVNRVTPGDNPKTVLYKRVDNPEIVAAFLKDPRTDINLSWPILSAIVGDAHDSMELLVRDDRFIARSDDIMQAIARQSPKSLSILIESGKYNLTPHFPGGFSFGWRAVYDDCYGCLEVLLKAGIDPNAGNPFNESLSKDDRYWQLLVTQPTFDPNRHQSIHEAIQASRLSALKALVELPSANLDFDLDDYSKFTPLQLAVHEPIAYLETLLQAGANPNVIYASIDRETALKEAVAFDKLDHARMLLEYDANPNLARENKPRPLCLAEGGAMRDLLESYGAVCP